MFVIKKILYYISVLYKRCCVRASQFQFQVHVQLFMIDVKTEVPLIRLSCLLNTYLRVINIFRSFIV